MKACCPPGEGCNSPYGGEPCALQRLKAVPDPEAQRALGLWRRYQHSRRSAVGRERRVLRRAYGRVRDRALPPWRPTAPA